MSELTEVAYTTKLCLEFSSGDTVDIEMKEIGRIWITSRDLSNSHFTSYFSCASDFIASYKKSSCISTDPIPSLEESVLM